MKPHDIDGIAAWLNGWSTAAARKSYKCNPHWRVHEDALRTAWDEGWQYFVVHAPRDMLSDEQRAYRDIYEA